MHWAMKTYFVFDAVGNQIAQVDALENATYFVFDAVGNQVAQVRCIRKSALFLLR